MRRLLPALTLIAFLGVAAWWAATNTALGPWIESLSTDDGPTGLSQSTPGGGQGDDEAPQPFEPRARPGQPLLVELVEPPNTHYGKARWTEADEVFAKLADDLDAVDYDPLLGHAARELAAFYALERQMAPSGSLQFILDSAGAPEWDVLRTMLVTNDTGLKSLDERVRMLAAEAKGPIRIGVGESYPAVPPLRRYLAILVSTSPLELNPVPRLLKAGGTVTLSGRLPARYKDLKAVALTPEGRWETIKAERGRDESFVATLDVGDVDGVLSIELIAQRATGPHPLAQLELMVGGGIPEQFEGSWPPDESDITTSAQAEVLALKLLNQDRVHAHLPALVRDPRLDRVARGHSRDMRDNGFTGHTSPSTGTLGDRLKKAHYPALFRAENIATNQSLHDAQTGLLSSLAHRRNILATAPNRVGIGVAIRSPKPAAAGTQTKGKKLFYLTQVFAKPSERIDPARALTRIKERLNAARVAAKRSPLRWDKALARVAQSAAKTGKATPSSVLDAAKRYARRGAAASVSSLGGLDGLEVPGLVTDKRYRRIGVGVFQTTPAPGEVPTILVVIVAAG